MRLAILISICVGLAACADAAPSDEAMPLKRLPIAKHLSRHEGTNVQRMRSEHGRDQSQKSRLRLRIDAGNAKPQRPGLDRCGISAVLVCPEN
ncbi:hypothetical protein LQ948_08050 [Jiella sp. MQZ9-1]|uniref:Uncharacterized protein n=1 Tax=Jiella flava TaxID=2816857 RepID=A0A939FXK7_9HYPH|nr:hypothetical protein [Jiella flava]MBO0662739.1 hypothetical protein [Jiella flava]MCD2471161.1 hypothetical protein [Jiella flava]